MLYDRLMRGFFTAEDGGASGAGEPATSPDSQEPPDPAQDGQGATQKEKMYTASEAQAMIDSAMSRKLRDMPTKEEVKAFREWKATQQTEAEALAEKLAAAEAAQAEAAKIQSVAGAKIAALDAGITKEHLDDAVVLAMARVSDDVAIEEAMKAIAAKNPAWMAAKPNMPEAGGNPPDNNDPYAGLTKEAFLKLPYEERVKLKTERPEIYEKIK